MSLLLWLKREDPAEILKEQGKHVQNPVLEKFGGERESQEGFQEEEEGQLDPRVRADPGFGAEMRAIQAQGKGWR